MALFDKLKNKDYATRFHDALDESPDAAYSILEEWYSAAPKNPNGTVQESNLLYAIIWANASSMDMLVLVHMSRVATQLKADNKALNPFFKDLAFHSLQNRCFMNATDLDSCKIFDEQIRPLY